jgi:hypothetical protein
MNRREAGLSNTLSAHTLYVGSRDGNAFSTSDRNEVLDAIASAFDSFTVMDAEGYYRGKCVATLVIKIATDDQTVVEALARQLGGLLDQQSVGVETGGYFRSLPMD